MTEKEYKNTHRALTLALMTSGVTIGCGLHMTNNVAKVTFTGLGILGAIEACNVQVELEREYGKEFS